MSCAALPLLVCEDRLPTGCLQQQTKSWSTAALRGQMDVRLVCTFVACCVSVLTWRVASNRPSGLGSICPALAWWVGAGSARSARGQWQTKDSLNKLSWALTHYLARSFLLVSYCATQARMQQDVSQHESAFMPQYHTALFLRSLPCSWRATMQPGLFSSHCSLSGSSIQPPPFPLPCRWPIAVQLAISESLVWSVNDLYQRLQVK